MENEPLRMRIDPGDGTEPCIFDLPEGWTRSPNHNTSKYAMNVAFGKHAWRGVYLNDGRGNGYFAPGWNGRRLGRNMRIVQRIAGAAFLATVLFFLGWAAVEARNNAEYYRLAAEGIETEAAVHAVEVQRTFSAGVGRGSSRKYTTETTADITYSVNGSAHSTVLREKHTYPSEYPDPEWFEGERVRIYVDPQDPQHVRPFSEFLDARATPVNETFWFMGVGGAAVSAVPAIIYAVARNARRKAEAL